MESLSNTSPVDIEQEMKRSYLDYAMSVIIGRALPDVRDGLKPVHRRVLYAMQDTGNTADKPPRKSAKIVGEVIGKYHPHGDSAVYDTIVRMAQDFSLRYPLVNGQGNFGSIDGDPPAAMRYTEVRMTKLAHSMLRDIDKDTVDFAPNYDASESEPIVLPTVLPGLLVNGSAGIAVGMATNIPPHNLGEVVDALVHLIDHPDADVLDLMRFIPGPDFPTGGIIYGRGGILSAYRTGRGRIRVRGRVEIEKNKKGDRESLVIHEIPYQVNKAHLVSEIASLVQQKRIEGITEVRDESDREGLRVVIELRKGEPAEIVRNNLYKYTRLQSTFGVIFLAIVEGQPRVLDLRQMLSHFIAFRREVVVRRTAFELARAEERLHILEALKVALDHLDEVIEIIRAAPSPPEARESLRLRFKFSEKQAQAILDMRLQRLTGLERDKIVQEYEETVALIARLKEILESEDEVREIIKEELLELRGTYVDERRSEIVDDLDDITVEELIPNSEMVVTSTFDGYIKRCALSTYRSQRRGGRGRKGMTPRQEDLLEHLFVGRMHSYILAFSDRGRVYWLRVRNIPESVTGRGRPIVNLIQMQADEKIEALLPLTGFDVAQNVVMVTEKGVIKRTRLDAFSRPRSAGIIALSIDDDDRLLSVDLTSDEDQIFIATRSGQAIRFEEGDVRVMGRTARGVRAINLRGDDIVVGMDVVRDRSEILTITEAGYGKRTPLDDYRVQGRGGYGIRNIKTTESRGQVVSVLEVNEDDQIIAMTRNGIVLRVKVDEIRSMGRDTQGVRIIRLDEGDQVVSVAKLVDPDDEAEIDENGDDTPGEGTDGSAEDAASESEDTAPTEEP